MSAFAAAIADALATVNDVAGELVTYHRGELATDPIVGVPGSSLWETADANEIPITSASRDWIFKASELVIDGVVIKPRRGDLVKQTVAGVQTVYEVLPDGDDQRFRYCDRARTRLRVHTKERPA